MMYSTSLYDGHSLQSAMAYSLETDCGVFRFFFMFSNCAVRAAVCSLTFFRRASAELILCAAWTWVCRRGVFDLAKSFGEMSNSQSNEHDLKQFLIRIPT